MSQFEDFGLAEPLLEAVRQEGYDNPTPIQEQAIPIVMAGEDILGCAQTGTGKTAAFALPILHRLNTELPGKHKRRIRSLILTPTRELAAQIGESFEAYGRNVSIRSTVIFGGVKQRRQVAALKHGVDVLVATPGRLMDLMHQKIVRLDSVEVFVLDEADRMLDMGFINDVRRIVRSIPDERQTLLFSATMPPPVRRLADSILRQKYSEVTIAPEAPAAETVEQGVYFVDRSDKHHLLSHVLEDCNVTKALIFTRTKRGADTVTRRLRKQKVPVEAIHSDKSQNARTRALDGFKSGKTRVLVASDIAARGIDVDDISHVINYDLPQEPEVYVHRIGRTGRAGASGKALTFCDPNEREALVTIEKLINLQIPTIMDHPWHNPIPSVNPKPESKDQGDRKRGSRGSSNGGRSRSRRRSQGKDKSDGQSRGQNTQQNAQNADQKPRKKRRRRRRRSRKKSPTAE